MRVSLGSPGMSQNSYHLSLLQPCAAYAWPPETTACSHYVQPDELKSGCTVAFVTLQAGDVRR